MPCSKQEWVSASQMIEAIADSEVTHSDIHRLQVAVLHGTALTKAEKLEVSRTLGVLDSILTDARENEWRP